MTNATATLICALAPIERSPFPRMLAQQRPTDLGANSPVPVNKKVGGALLAKA